MASRSLSIYHDGSANQLRIAQSPDNTTNYDVGKSWSPSTGVWYWLVVVNDGSVVKAYANGTQIGTDWTKYTLAYTSSNFLIGSSSDAGNITLLNGYINEIIMFKDYAMSPTTPTYKLYGEVKIS